MSESTHTEAAFSSTTVRRSALWGGASSMVLRLANWAVMIVAVRIVTPEEFGVFAVALTVHMVVANIAELGVSATLIRRDTDPDELGPSTAFISIAAGAFLAAAMAIGAPWLAQLLGAPDATDPLRVMALSVLLVGVFAVSQALLVRDFRQRGLFGANALSVVVGNTVLIVLLLYGSGPMAFAWSRVVGQLVAGVVIVWLARRWYWPKLQPSAAGVVLRFGLPLAFANLIHYTLLNLDFVFVGRSLGAAALGVYLLAFNIAAWPYSIFGAMINSVGMPAFSEVKHDKNELQRSVGIAAQATASLAFPMAVLLSVLSGPLVATVYGTKWVEAAPVLSILAIYGALFLLSLVFANVLSGVGRSGLLLLLQLIWLTALVPTMALLVERRGMMGAGIAHLVVISLVALPGYFVLLWRSEGISPIPVVRSVISPAVASIVAGASALLVGGLFEGSGWRLLAGLVAGGLVYGLLASPVLARHLGDRLPILPALLAPVAATVHRVFARLGIESWMTPQVDSPATLVAHGNGESSG